MNILFETFAEKSRKENKSICFTFRAVSKWEIFTAESSLTLSVANFLSSRQHRSWCALLFFLLIAKCKLTKEFFVIRYQKLIHIAENNCWLMWVLKSLKSHNCQQLPLAKKKLKENSKRINKKNVFQPQRGYVSAFMFILQTVYLWIC